MYIPGLFFIELAEEPIPGRAEVINWGFALFTVCFLITAHFLSSKPWLLSSMKDDLFRNKERHSIFYETADYEFSDKVLLVFQTLILISLAGFCFFIHYFPEINESAELLLSNVGITFALFLAYVIYKYATYNFIGWVFFKKEQIIRWNNNFLSLIELEGLILFIPVLILFFIPNLYIISLYLVSFILIIAFLIHLFTLYRIFFHSNGTLLHFILYLCAQEIAPLFILFKGLVYFLKM